MHSPAKDAYVIPTGTIFMTIERVYIHPTIVIAVKKLCINNVNPFASFAKLFAAVPKITARIRTMYATILLTIKDYYYLVILSTNFCIIGATIVVAISATGKLTDQALKNLL